MIEPLAAAALMIGVDGLFIEVHDNPEEAKCDGDIAYPLHQLEKMLKRLKAIDAVSRHLYHNSCQDQFKQAS